MPSVAALARLLTATTGVLAASAAAAAPAPAAATGPVAYAAGPSAKALKVSWSKPKGARAAASQPKCGVKVRHRFRVRTVTFRINGRRIATDHHSPYTCRWKASQTRPGRYRLVATATDVRRHRASATMTVVVKPPVAAPQTDGLRVGLNANSQGWGAQAGVQQDKALGSGVKWLREQLNWDQIEPQRGQWDFSVPDAVFTAAAHRGATVLPLLMNTPGWAGSAKTEIPSDPGDYADYVAHVTARYGPGGTFWASHPELPSKAPEYFEIWNEPYYPQFSNGRIDPARYARLFKAAASAGRAANPQAKFLLASDNQIKDYTGAWVYWSDAMVDAVPDIGNYADGIAVHPYSKHFTPDTPVASYAADKFLRLAQIHDHFAARGINRPVWITEVGWSTCTGDTTFCVSEAQQASNITTMFSMLHNQLTYVKAVFLYHMEDLGSDQSNSELHYGLLHQDGSPKPGWAALKAGAATGV
jgi:hypothetical protein